MEKNNMDFDLWLKDFIPSTIMKEYKRKHYIPDVDLSIANFDVFLKERESLLFEALSRELKI